MKLTSHLIAIFLFATIYSCSSKYDEMNIPVKHWKIKFGDNKEWAKSEFDDSAWDTIGVAKPWDNYGYSNKSGYAWYRAKVFIPSSLKDKSQYGNDLIINIGKVDDADMTFLNGQPIGVNGESIPIEGVDKVRFKEGFFWNTPREYRMSVDDKRILWDKENVLAVRVWNANGLGGIFNANPAMVRMLDMSDYVEIDNESFAYEISNQKDFTKGFVIKNHATNLQFSGSFSIIVRDRISGAEVYNKVEEVTLKSGEERNILLTFSTEPGQNCMAEFKYVDSKTGDKLISSEYVPYILTPVAADKPSINGPVVYGVRPGREFLYRMPVSGKRPMKYGVKGLPVGLKVDSKIGVIMGKAPHKGHYKVVFTAENKSGKAEKEFTIVSGDKLALTPPMGWNSWNCWGLSVSDEKIRISAGEMVKSGLADHGFTYVNIDDGWEAKKRTNKGLLMGNKKFPDFPGLSKYVHSLGLKLGIYSGPGPYTCGGHLASYQHEYIDAKTWAEWGIDYLKYDWCAYESVAKDHSLPELKKPYILMRKALDKVDRDIVYSLCQYGWGDVWKWGREVGGDLWRTTGDITDTWASLKGIGFQQNRMSPYAGPSGWNDPDMLIVGWVGWSRKLHPTKLTPDEQYTHITLWSLLSAPLLLGNDMARIDAFTLNLLTNDEVLAIDQDPLGKQADRVYDKDNVQYWLKKLTDGSYALGIFNLNDDLKKIKVNLKDAGIDGTFRVRDLWRQKDVSENAATVDAVVPAHGVYLLKLSK